MIEIDCILTHDAECIVMDSLTPGQESKGRHNQGESAGTHMTKDRNGTMSV